MAKPKNLARKVEPHEPIDLDTLPTDADGGMSKHDGAEALEPLLQELDELQGLMWGAQTHAMLVVLQGRDAAGKDGTIRRVLGAVNPQGLDIASFKVPTPEEAARDFLWRAHAAAPRKGVIGVYNRSHYEEVLVVRVHRLAPELHVEQAYGLINDYERLLTGTGTIVVKLFLHLSRDEQRKRLLEREEDASKAWKLSPGDWAEREHWDAYTKAYAEALSRCSKSDAPWYVVPADRKWAAHLAAAQVMVEALRPFRKGWIGALESLQARSLDELSRIEKK